LSWRPRLTKLHKPFAIGCAHNNARYERDAHSHFTPSSGIHRQWRRRDWNTPTAVYEFTVERAKGLHLTMLDSMIETGGGSVMGGIMGSQKTRMIHGNLNAQSQRSLKWKETVPSVLSTTQRSSTHGRITSARSLSCSPCQYHALASNVSRSDRAYLECAWQKCTTTSRPTEYPPTDKVLIAEWNNLSNRSTFR
jgi:hypothetical protein